MSKLARIGVVGLALAVLMGCATGGGQQPAPDPGATVQQILNLVTLLCPGADAAAVVNTCLPYVNDSAKLRVCVEGAVVGQCLPKPRQPSPSPTVAVATATQTAPPTGAPTSSPTAPSVATSTATTVPSPVAQVFPPTVDFVNGLDHADASGEGEFNTWMVVKISDPVHFTPPCSPAECPYFWRPAGMGMACDHMFTEPNAPAGIFEPRAADADNPLGRWVSIMWYVCSAREWDPVSIPPVEIRAAGCASCLPDFAHPPLGPTSSPVAWTFRTKRDVDYFNGTAAGHGWVYVCLANGAYTCKDAGELAKLPDGGTPHVFTDGQCASGKVVLPVGSGGRCKGPYRIDTN